MEIQRKKFKFHQSYYYIYSDGRIENRNHHPMRTFNNGNGYLYITFASNGYKQNLYVHRLVAKLFVNNPKNFNEVNHIDGVKTNNNAENLEWCSRKQNAAHALEIGLTPTGTNHYRSKINTDQVKLIFMAYHAGVPSKTIMNAFDVSRHTVCDIAKRRIYKRETEDIGGV